LDLQLDLKKENDKDNFSNFDTCLNNFFATDTLMEDAGYECVTCRKKTIAQIRFRLIKLPEVLIVQAKRFTHLGTKLQTPLNFPKTFEFEERLLEQEDEHQYSLYAFIVHHGYSASRGHYFCYVKLASGDWCKYNDDSVTIIPDIDAQPQK